jgi:polar amino acid transport system substrate-binding protein
MRRVLVGLFILTLSLFGCAEEGSTSGQGSSAQSCDKADLPLYQEGTLTVATDRPAYPPWFKGSPKDYSGYEGELAAEIADRFGLPIKWVVEPFNKSYAPGQKEYDFDINEITITKERDQAVDFSDGYFDNNQGILALKDNPITDVSSIDDLAGYRLGTQVGTTSLDFINSVIQPDEDPKVFDTTNDVKSALESGQIDALITDVVTTVYLRDFEIEGSEVIGQYPEKEEFGMLFEEGSELRDCVNEVLADIKADGTLQKLQDKFLQQYLSVPTLE